MQYKSGVASSAERSHGHPAAFSRLWRARSIDCRIATDRHRDPDV